MSFSLDRRKFLGTALAGAAIVAFDPLTGSWVTAAEAASGAPAGAVAVPDLDGELTTDPAALAEVADDFGHLVHRTPLAVLRPGSARDIQKLVRYANRHHLAVSVRGQGHSTDGQSQVHAGVVVDSRTLATIHEIGPGRAVVDAGVTWLELLTAAVAHGLTPPVFTDYLGLSVGGTLSVGGIGGTTQTYGMQVDTVLELEVVTGEGELVRCSPARNRALFEAVLGSLGQLAIVVRATIRLVRAPAAARGYQLFYTDLDTYLADQRRLLGQRRFSSLEGQAVRDAADTRWDFFVDAAAYHDGTPPSDATITRGLRFDPARTVVTDYSYVEWVNRLQPTVDFLKSIGAWTLP
ncbi:MAG TPA: FAD-binding protein, partial [Mycobacteriales bacterium]|nr:FAD-binding protein [Mycobacteriales bacterium]